VNRSWNARRQSYSPGQRLLASVGGVSLISSSLSAVDRRVRRAANFSQWLRLLCHDTRRHSRSLLASAHRSTSAASPPMPAPLSCSPTQSSRFLCADPTHPPLSRHRQHRGQCRSRRIPPPAEAPCLTSARSLSVLCPPSRSTLQAHHNQPSAHRRRARLTLWPFLPRSRSRATTGEGAASLSAGTQGLARR
jgi:hypothetical protein